MKQWTERFACLRSILRPKETHMPREALRLQTVKTKKKMKWEAVVSVYSVLHSDNV